MSDDHHPERHDAEVSHSTVRGIFRAGAVLWAVTAIVIVALVVVLVIAMA